MSTFYSKTKLYKRQIICKFSKKMLNGFVNNVQSTLTMVDYLQFNTVILCLPKISMFPILGTQCCIHFVPFFCKI